MTEKPDKSQLKRILTHVAFWTCLYFLDVVIFGFDWKNFPLFFKFASLELWGQMIFAYTVNYWIFPQLIQKKKYVQAAIALPALFIACGFVNNTLYVEFNAYAPEDHVAPTDFIKILVRGFYVLPKACIAIIVKLAKVWYENERRVGNMEKAKLESDLKVLKDQVNPHFMFNTLGNLYGLVKRNPDQAQEVILGLSRIFSYILHDSNQQRISLSKELDCIRNYINLEKVRYSDQLYVSLNVQENMESLQILPLILFPFVENSFKHGASEVGDEAYVNIDLSMDQNYFCFKIENRKNSTPSEIPHSGIGLANARQRLELTYKEDHSLQIIDGHTHFLVILKIALSRLHPLTS